MQLKLRWLKKNNACIPGLAWYSAQGTDDFLELCKRARDGGKFDYFHWCYAKKVNRKTRILWSCYAAELVLPIFEILYPQDKRPRFAIESARECAEKNTKKNSAPYAATNAANAATYAAANAAVYAAYAAANAANAATYAAANAAVYAADAAANAADAAAYSVVAAEKDIQKKIMDYGIKLLEGECTRT